MFYSLSIIVISFVGQPPWHFAMAVVVNIWEKWKKLYMICTFRDFTLSLLLKLKIDLLYGKRIGIPYQKK